MAARPCPICRDGNLPEPEFRQDGGQFVQTMRRPKAAVAPQVAAQVEGGGKVLRESWLRSLADALGVGAEQVTAQVAAQVVEVLRAAGAGVRSREELQAAAGIKHREHFRKAYLEPLMRAACLGRTIPNKPTSRVQKYRLTEKGRAWMTGGESGG